ncbi:hypothetical protein Golomagni_06943 [Golovinomyces magnicellulatus]|nr:hypothetical protein Golomagni_06943 [Golovinomyces magnicellulatus]
MGWVNLYLGNSLSSRLSRYWNAIQGCEHDKLSHLDPSLESVQDTGAQQPPFTKITKWNMLAFLGLASFVCSLVVTTMRWSLPPNARHLPTRRFCGDTPESAIRNGCKFDIMSFAWSRPECFDAELMEEFLSRYNWTWWRDPAGQHAVSFRDVSAGQNPELFVSWEYHKAHCTFMWKKMHKAILHQKPLDSYIGNLHHTLHCEKMLLSHDTSLMEIKTVIKTKYPDCPA